MKIQLTRPFFNNRERELLNICLSSGWVTSGPFVDKFEKEFARKHHAKYALTTTSCTASLHLAMATLGICPGDEVIVPAFTWITSANCAEYMGAKVVFADVNLNTFNIDTHSLEKNISPNTKAIVVVHLFGLPADMDPIMRIAKRHNLYVVEDAACAVGAVYKKQPVGTFGDIGCFSFHPRKIITTGEGGMLTTNDLHIYNLLKSLRSHGTSTFMRRRKFPLKDYDLGTFDFLGYNYRMSDIQAAIGVAQLEKLDFLISERRKLAQQYDYLLSEVDEVATPYVPEKCFHTYQSYVIRILKGGKSLRNRLIEHFMSKKIQTRPGTHAVHRLDYYVRRYALSPSDFPNASTCEDTTVTLPLFHGMKKEEQVTVVNCIKDKITKKK